MIGASEATAKRAVDELIKTGHARIERKGKNRGPNATRERAVSLTRWNTETAAGNPSRPIEIWEKRNRAT